MAKIVVIGSANIDYVIKLPRLPLKGETVSEGRFFQALGGKGANQAVASRKMGSEVWFIGCVGKDYEGKVILENLENLGIDVSGIQQTEEPTGRAFIFVDEKGDNMIAVAPGANRNLTPEQVKKFSEVIKSADIVLAQLEVPPQSVLTAFKIAVSGGAKTILNPAPAREIPPELFEFCDFVTPNRLESEFYTGVHISDKASAERAAMEFAKRGIQNVIITMGEKGALLFTYESSRFIESFEVESVDTTGAGDAFNGALATCIAEGFDVENALIYANAAGALATTKEGAIPSLPSREEVENFLKARR